MKEIKRSVESNTNYGMGCGPMSITAVVGEIVIEEAGTKKYITMCWVDAASDGIEFDVTDKSIAKYLLDCDEDMDELDEIRDNAEINECLELTEEYEGEYKEQYDELYKMVMDKCVEEELLDPEDFE